MSKPLDATGHQQTVSRETLINCAIEDIKTYSFAIGTARNQTDIDSYKRLRDSAEEALREAIAQPAETRQKLYPEMAKPSAASETRTIGSDITEEIKAWQPPSAPSATRAPGWVPTAERQPDVDGRLWAILTKSMRNGVSTGYIPLFEYYHFTNGWATDDTVTHWLDCSLHPLPKAQP